MTYEFPGVSLNDHLLVLFALLVPVGLIWLKHKSFEWIVKNAGRASIGLTSKAQKVKVPHQTGIGSQSAVRTKPHGFLGIGVFCTVFLAEGALFYGPVHGMGWIRN